jgi:hypothetical protein
MLASVTARRKLPLTRYFVRLAVLHEMVGKPPRPIGPQYWARNLGP